MTKPSQAEIDRVKRQNARTHKDAGVSLSKETLSPGDTAKLNATLKAGRVLREMAAKKRGASSVSGLKKAPAKSDDERLRTQQAVGYKRKLAKAPHKGFMGSTPTKKDSEDELFRKKRRLEYQKSFEATAKRSR